MDCHCSTNSGRHLNPILFNILSKLDSSRAHENKCNYNRMLLRCNLEARQTACLKSPSDICKNASTVLVKTVFFMKNLPAFNQLLPSDRFLLLKSCWAPLFILGLAQDSVAFEVTDTPSHSLLKKILLNQQQGSEIERERPTMAGVGKMTSCINKFWSLDLSPKEYAYLKGTTIFNPDVPDLKAAMLIEGLQQEAQHALREVVQLLHPQDEERFARILLTASMLQSVTPTVITELLFRPLIGQADLLELLVDMLFCT